MICIKININVWVPNACNIEYFKEIFKYHIGIFCLFPRLPLIWGIKFQDNKVQSPASVCFNFLFYMWKNKFQYVDVRIVVLYIDMFVLMEILRLVRLNLPTLQIMRNINNKTVIVWSLIVLTFNAERRTVFCKTINTY